MPYLKNLLNAKRNHIETKPYGLIHESESCLLLDVNVSKEGVGVVYLIILETKN